MELRKPRKLTAFLTAAVLIGSAALTVTLNTQNISAVSDKKAKAAVEVTEPAKPEDGEYEVTAWWKAGLSEYRDNLSLVSYEKVEVPTEPVKKVKTAENVVVNDTGISYIEPDSGYQGIQIVPETPEIFYEVEDDETVMGELAEQPANETPAQTQENIWDNVSAGEGVTVPENSIKPDTGTPPVPVADVEPGNFAFTTYGYGHGVGMSQNGANHYASYSGWDYQQILQHYYPGTYIQNTGASADDTISAGGVSGSVLDIVSMVTFNEVGCTMANEAIKAQAVAVYTYIMYKGGSADDLSPKSDPPQNVTDAVKSVLGEAVFYDGSYALAMFSASSGGSSASCYDIFYQDIPYLRSVYCEYDSQCDPHYGSVEVISADQVRADLETCLGITLSDDPSNWITITEGDGGYAAYVNIDNQITVKGNDFRGYLGLKSPKFTCTYN